MAGFFNDLSSFLGADVISTTNQAIANQKAKQAKTEAAQAFIAKSLSPYPTAQAAYLATGKTEDAKRIRSMQQGHNISYTDANGNPVTEYIPPLLPMEGPQPQPQQGYNPAETMGGGFMPMPAPAPVSTQQLAPQTPTQSINQSMDVSPTAGVQGGYDPMAGVGNGGLPMPQMQPQQPQQAQGGLHPSIQRIMAAFAYAKQNGTPPLLADADVNNPNPQVQQWVKEHNIVPDTGTDPYAQGGQGTQPMPPQQMADASMGAPTDYQQPSMAGTSVNGGLYPEQQAKVDALKQAAANNPNRRDAANQSFQAQQLEASMLNQNMTQERGIQAQQDQQQNAQGFAMFKSQIDEKRKPITDYLVKDPYRRENVPLINSLIQAIPNAPTGKLESSGLAWARGVAANVGLTDQKDATYQQLITRSANALAVQDLSKMAPASDGDRIVLSGINASLGNTPLGNLASAVALSEAQRVKKVYNAGLEAYQDSLAYASPGMPIPNKDKFMKEYFSQNLERNDNIPAFGKIAGAPGARIVRKGGIVNGQPVAGDAVIADIDGVTTGMLLSEFLLPEE
jgi:hypothetical protein